VPPVLEQPKEGRFIMLLDWQEPDLPALLPSTQLPWGSRSLSERQGTLEFKRRSALLLTHRARLARFQVSPRLTRDQELEALRQFKSAHGVVRCPPAFAAPTQAFVG